MSDGLPRWWYAKPLSESERLRLLAPSEPRSPGGIFLGPSYDLSAHYARVRSLHDDYPLSSEQECTKHLVELLETIAEKSGRASSDHLIDALINPISELLQAEDIFRPVLLGPGDGNTADFVDYFLRPYLRDAELFYTEHERIVPAIYATVISFFSRLLSSLPESAHGELDQTDSSVPLIELAGRPDHLIMETMSVFRPTADRDLPRFFCRVGETIRANILRASGIIEGQPVRANQIVFPTDSFPQKSAVELVSLYLRNTPFEQLLLTPVPFRVPDSIRFEHHWIVAGSGHGKTQTLQHLIASDLPSVLAGSRTVIVIDSQGDLIKNVSHLECFFQHPDRLCIIDPTDIDYPVQLNLFSLGSVRAESYSPVEQERLQNAAIELYEYILDALLGAELTAKQSTLFRYVLRLLTVTDGATIHTFREIMEGHLPEQGLARVRPNVRNFFEREFFTSEYTQTKRQVVRRLWTILENPTFERMFSHADSKLDLFAEMNAGKVILINTAKDFLKDQGAETFGRFFIALIAQAAQERANVANRLPCFVYIDEAQEYFDSKISTILEQARKFNVGMIMAHQYLGQLSPKLLESFSANTSIKYAGGVSDQDARSFSRMIRCDHAFVERQPRGSFAAFVRNFTAHAVSLRIPFRTLESMPRATDDEFQWVLSQNRLRYAVTQEQPQHTATRHDQPPRAATERDSARRSPTPPSPTPATPKHRQTRGDTPEEGDDWRS